MDLLAFVGAWYPETPYAARAQSLRNALVALDAPEGALPADSLAQLADPYGPPLDEAAVAAAPPGTFGLEGDAPLAPEIGGYTWRVAAVSDPRVANGLLRRYLRQGLRAGALREQGEDGPLFVLLVGQFPSGTDAEAAREGLPETASEGGPQIVPLAGLTLLDPAALQELADPR